MNVKKAVGRAWGLVCSVGCHNTRLHLQAQDISGVHQHEAGAAPRAQVALKLMRRQDQFERELSARTNNGRALPSDSVVRTRGALAACARHDTTRGAGRGAQEWAGARTVHPHRCKPSIVRTCRGPAALINVAFQET